MGYKIGCIDKRFNIEKEEVRETIEACFNDPCMMDFIWNGDGFSFKMLGESVQYGRLYVDSMIDKPAIKVFYPAYYNQAEKVLIINKIIR